MQYPYDPHNAGPQISREIMSGDINEEALVDNEQTLAITLDSIADGVISTDLDGNIVRMNRVAQQLTGWPIKEAKGLPLTRVFELVESETGAKIESLFDAVMCSESSVNLAPNTSLVARDGTHFMIEDSAAPIRNRDTDRASGMVLVFRDVTEKKKLETEYQQAKKLETIGRLAGGVAHDFNNLLAGIMGYSERLVIELRGDLRLQGYARSVLETTERAAKLTKQLLAFSRKGKMVSMPVDMHARITSALILLQSTTDKRISIVSNFHASGATVVGDPTMLEAALLNLGINSRDATAVGGKIVVETSTVMLDQKTISAESLSIAPGEYLEITVSDTGTGMSVEAMEHLYEPFFTTKDIGRGTGLGLAAVYGTMKEHHGAITVKSSLGMGTKFTLYLPLSRITVAEKKMEDTQEFFGSGCILLVDDERVIRETASDMLQAIGYEVLLAENGAEALEIYKRELGRIKLVILDVVMPHLSGPDTFFALKNINKGIKVIFASGYTFDNGANELLSHGVYGFIQKPFRRNELYKVLQTCLLKSESPRLVANV